MSFDLVAYAEARRYRARNLHDGGPVPPARVRGKPRRLGYKGEHDRWDAIVGRLGYVAMDGQRLSVYACYPSRRRKTSGCRGLVGAAVRITQEGDLDVSGWSPVDCLEAIVAVLRVYKRRPGRSPLELHHLRPVQSGLGAPAATQAAG